MTDKSECEKCGGRLVQNGFVAPEVMCVCDLRRQVRDILMFTSSGLATLSAAQRGIAIRAILDELRRADFGGGA